MKSYSEVLEAKVSRESWKLYEIFRFLDRDTDAPWKIHLIDGLSDAERNTVRIHLFVRDQAFYNWKQGSWLETEAYHLGEKVGYSPSPCELADDFESTHTPHRYELAHLLTWTWNVRVEPCEDAAAPIALVNFLERAENISTIPYRHRYYRELLCRS